MAQVEAQDGFWEDPETVARFARLEPDARMVAVLAGRPAGLRVLDLGCAAGRNTEWLVAQGFDVYALDASRAMVAHTRARLAPLVGEIEARERVLCRPMDDLSGYADAFFDVIVAIGIYHAARSEAEWHRALAESSRVLRPGGELIVSHFAPSSRPHGLPLALIPGTRHGYSGFAEGRTMVLLTAVELDAYVARYGLSPLAPTEAVRTATERGYRESVCAHYVKGALPQARV
jgi:SAM-dependent methyltransferase